MTSTDLSNGPVSGLPTYNVKNNPSIFHYNTIQKINYFRQLLLAISFNHTFIDVVTGLKNLGRQYYNNNPKKFCSTIRLNPIQGFGGQYITVYLPSAGGFIDNSIQYVPIDNTKTTYLMRVLQNQQLPTCWSNKVRDCGKGVCVSYSVSPQDAPTALSYNEQVLYYYIKNADFFTRTLQLLANSFRVYAEQKYQCYTLVFPEDLYSGNVNQRTFTVTNDFLKSVYYEYLHKSRFGNPYKLPAPIINNIPYELPITTNYTEEELTKIINNNTNSSTI
jgi:hypothetical protein